MNYLNINLGAFGIIATILAIAATVVAFVMIVPERKREKLGRSGNARGSCGSCPDGDSLPAR